MNWFCDGFSQTNFAIFIYIPLQIPSHNYFNDGKRERVVFYFLLSVPVPFLLSCQECLNYSNLVDLDNSLQQGKSPDATTIRLD